MPDQTGDSNEIKSMAPMKKTIRNVIPPTLVFVIHRSIVFQFLFILILFEAENHRTLEAERLGLDPYQSNCSFLSFSSAGRGGVPTSFSSMILRFSGTLGLKALFVPVCWSWRVFVVVVWNLAVSWSFGEESDPDRVDSRRA